MLQSTRWFANVTYWISTCLLCWLLMQVIHELGHVIGALATGGRIQKVVLHPFTISRTDVSPNPHPLVEVWAGPLVGAILPLLAWYSCFLFRINSFGGWLRFFAGFCLIANGSYLGMGLIQPIGDAEELVRLGVARIFLGLFAFITIPVGFQLWNGMGHEFGFGPKSQIVTWKKGLWISVILLCVVVFECLLSPMN